jgi:dTDP-glucose 4,6-dehydratase
MRILITGGAGFLGSHLCAHFLRQGHHVTCLDKRANENGFIKRLREFPFFKIDQRDLLVSPWVNLPEHYDEWRSCDSPWYAGDLDYVLHFASYPSPKDYMAKPIETLKADSLGTLEMLQLAKIKDAVFVLASTGHFDLERDPTNERTLYNEGKRFGEAATMAVHRCEQVSTRIVRMFNSYGPGMRIDDGRIVPTFIVRALRNEEIQVFGGMQPISLTYVDDMVAGIEAVMLSEFSAPVELGQPHRADVLAVADMIVELARSKSKIKIITAKTKEERFPDLMLAGQLGWEPKVSLREGLARTIEDFRSRI